MICIRGAEDLTPITKDDPGYETLLASITCLRENMLYMSDNNRALVEETSEYIRYYAVTIIELKKDVKRD